MINKNILIIIIALSIILSISFVSSQDFTFKLNELANFTIPCTLDGSPCSSSGTCNTTIRNPNNTYNINNKLMAFNGGGDFTIPVNFSVLGTSTYRVSCSEAGQNDTVNGEILITPTGREFTEGQGTTAIGILIGVLALSFLFLIIGFSLEKNPATLPLGFLFVVFAIILGIYSLHLSYTYTNDILQYESMMSVSSTVYIVVLWTLVGIAILSSALMLVRFIKELGNINKTKKFGQGFNPITNTYE